MMENAKKKGCYMNMTFTEFYQKFGLLKYPFNTFTTEDEREKGELFVDPIDYALIKDAFKNRALLLWRAIVEREKQRLCLI